MATAADVLQRKGPEVLTVEETEPVLAAVETMVAKSIGALVVTRDGAITGMFTERDYFRRIVLQPHPNRLIPVKEVMSSPVIYVTSDTTVEDCMALMTKCRIRHLPVIDGTSLAGIVSMGDLVQLQSEKRDVEMRFLQEYVTAR